MRSISSIAEELGMAFMLDSRRNLCPGCEPAYMKFSARDLRNNYLTAEGIELVVGRR